MCVNHAIIKITTEKRCFHLIPSILSYINKHRNKKGHNVFLIQDVRRRKNETIKNLYLIQHCIIQGEAISLREQITISLTFRLKYICICSFILYISVKIYFYIIENLGIDFLGGSKVKPTLVILTGEMTSQAQQTTRWVIFSDKLTI